MTSSSTRQADGTAASFRPGIDMQEQPGAAETATTIGVNDPRRVSGTRLHVTGHGFTPVFTLDQRQIAVGALSRVGAANLELGQRATLPDGTTIEFTEMREFAALQVSHDPAQLAVLISALTMLAGLMATLLVRQGRVFVRITPARDAGDRPGSATTTLTAAVLHRGGSADSRERSERLLRDLLDEQPTTDPERQPTRPDRTGS